MAVGRRLSLLAASIAAVLALGCVFLPWVAATPAGTLAGWGSEARPQFRGMLVIACAAVGLALLIGGGGSAGVRRRVLLELAATVLLIAVITVSTVLADPGSYTAGPASVASGAWVTVVALLVAMASALLGALTGDG